uniref:Double-stranded RNA-binding protein 6 n=1 Tax=Anthurium amnicola TaxID=1678845 RepID=A0A1D1XHG6_9ARAE
MLFEQDETGVYKNLLQEIAQRVGAPLPSYTTVRSGLGHLPVFTGTVELAGITFTGEPAKNKKQAEKNAAMAAWYSLKKLAQQTGSSSTDRESNDEQEQITIARALLNYRLKEKMATASNPNSTSLPRQFPVQPDKRPSMQPTHSMGSKILPFIRPKSAPRTRPSSPAPSRGPLSSPNLQTENYGVQMQKFPAVMAAPYVPIRHCRPFHGIAPSVTIRTSVPVFSAPPLPPPNHQRPPPVMCSPIHAAPPVHVRQVVPVFAAAPPPPVPSMPVQVKEHPHPRSFKAPPPQPSVPPPPPPPEKSVVLGEDFLFAPEPCVQKEEIPHSLKPLYRKEVMPLPPKPLVQVEVDPPTPNPSAPSDSPSSPSSSVQAEGIPSQNHTTMSSTHEKAADAAANDLQEHAVIQSLKQIEL